MVLDCSGSPLTVSWVSEVTGFVLRGGHILFAWPVVWGLSPAGGICLVAEVAILSLPQIHILLTSPCAWGGHAGASLSGDLSLRWVVVSFHPIFLLSALPGSL